MRNDLRVGIASISPATFFNLDRRLLVGRLLVRRFLVRRFLVRGLLVRGLLVRGLLVRGLMVGRLMVNRRGRSRVVVMVVFFNRSSVTYKTLISHPFIRKT